MEPTHAGSTNSRTPTRPTQSQHQGIQPRGRRKRSLQREHQEINFKISRRTSFLYQKTREIIIANANTIPIPHSTVLSTPNQSRQWKAEPIKKINAKARFLGASKIELDNFLTFSPQSNVNQNDEKPQGHNYHWQDGNPHTQHIC